MQNIPFSIIRDARWLRAVHITPQLLFGVVEHARQAGHSPVWAELWLLPVDFRAWLCSCYCPGSRFEALMTSANFVAGFRFIKWQVSDEAVWRGVEHSGKHVEQAAELPLGKLSDDVWYRQLAYMVCLLLEASQLIAWSLHRQCLA